MDRHKRVDLATQIFAEHDSAIRAIIRLYVTGSEEEDDVYQNLFLSLVCHPPPQPLVNVTAYLHTVIRNDVIDAVRRRKSHQEMVARYAMDQPRGEVQERPEDRLIRAEEMQRIRDLVANLLPAHEARAVTERYVHGRSIADIALLMGVKRRTGSRYACAGFKRLREAVVKHSL